MNDRKLAYELTVDDLIAFSRYHYVNSPTVRKQLLLARLVVIVMLMILAITFDRHFPFHLPIIIASGASILTLIFTPKLQRDALDKTMRKQYGEGRNRGVIGPKQLTPTDTGITIRGECDQHELSFTAIERIVRTDDHTYLYIGAANAHVIPHRDIATAQLDAFHQTLAAHVNTPIETAPSTASPIAAPRTPLHEVMAAFLHNRDTPCPACNYNLRDQSRATCPECGQTLRLVVEVDRPALPQKMWLASVIGVTFMSAHQLTLACITLVAVQSGKPSLFPIWALQLAVIYSIASPLIVVILLRWRKAFCAMTKANRIGCAMAMVLSQFLAILIMIGMAIR